MPKQNSIKTIPFSPRRQTRTDHTATSTEFKRGQRRITVQATNSLLNQSILLLGSQNSCPVAPGERMTIHAGSAVIRTAAVATGIKVQARKEIAAYLKQHPMKAGQCLTLTEESRGHWRLKVLPMPA